MEETGWVRCVTCRQKCQDESVDEKGECEKCRLPAPVVLGELAGLKELPLMSGDLALATEIGGIVSRALAAVPHTVRRVRNSEDEEFLEIVYHTQEIVQEQIEKARRKGFGASMSTVVVKVEGFRVSA